jgi:hydroxymethylpyrimidine/phosphomethylpyrimidine kinase
VAGARPFTVLSIGGSDPTGGAGIAGDLKTFAAHGAYGAAVVAAVTAQNHRGVTAAVEVGPDLVRAQLDAVLAQVAPRAVKTGMLLSPAVVAAVAPALAALGAPLVVDPVLAASAGGALAHAGLLDALAAHLFPQATVVTPNLAEAAVALGGPVRTGDEVAGARALRSRWGGVAVLLKGGHGAGDRAVDVLATEDGVFSLSLPRLTTPDGHGSGCALSASIACRLARGDALREAVVGAKGYLHRALAAAGPLGVGRGPVRHDVEAFATAPVVEVRGPS